jgi:ABC-type branched-subunit amino acid transport system substrate-binding protein
VTVSIVGLSVVSAGCGNRLPHDQIVADAGGLSRLAAAAPGGDGLDAFGGGGGDQTQTAVPDPGQTVAGGPSAGTGGSTVQPGRSVTAPGQSSAPADASGQQAAGGSAPTPRGAVKAGPGGTAPGTGGDAVPGAGAGGTGGGRGCTGPRPPITVGTVGSFSGVHAQATLNGLRGLQAWVKYINDHGGVSCHLIKHITADDGGDPARNQTLHRQLFETEGAIAFLFALSPIADSGSKDYINEKQIPDVAPLGAFDYVYDSPWVFPAYSAGKQLVAMTVGAAAQYALPQGKTKLATITCNEASFCAMANDVWASEAPKMGFQVVFQGKASLTQPDFTAQCLAARNAGAQVIGTAFATEGNKRLATSCENVGLKVIKVVSSVQAALDYQDTPAMDDTVVAMPVAPWFQTEIPGVRDFQDQMKKYAPSVVVDMQSVNGWAAGKAFEAATRNLPAGEVKKTDILEGLWSMPNDDLGGFTYPLSFTRGQPAVRKTCGWAVVLKGGKWTSHTKQFCR